MWYLDDEPNGCTDIRSDRVARAHHSHADNSANGRAVTRSHTSAFSVSDQQPHEMAHHESDALTNQAAQQESYSEPNCHSNQSPYHATDPFPVA